MRQIKTVSDMLQWHALTILFAWIALRSDVRSVRADDADDNQPVIDVLPRGAVARLGSDRLRHRDLVGAVRYSPDGRLIASADARSPIKFWDSVTGELQQTIPGGATPLEFSPDSRLLASGDQRGNIVRLWEVASGKSLGEWKLWPLGASSLAFSSDGRELFCNHYDGVSRILVATGESSVWKPKDFGVVAIAHSPRESLVAVGVPGSPQSDGAPTWNVQLQRSDTSDKLRTLTDSIPFSLWGLRFSAQGKYLTAVGGANAIGETVILVWRTDTWDLLVRLVADAGAQSAVSFDERWLVALSRTGLQFVELPNGRLAHNVRFDPVAMTPADNSLDFSPDGRFFAVGIGSQVDVWEVSTRQEITCWQGPHVRPIKTLAVSPDGRLLLAAEGVGGRWNNHSGSWSLWNVSKRRLIGRSRDDVANQSVSDATFSPDSKTFALGWRDKENKSWIELRSSADARPLGQWSVSVPASRMLFHPSGDLLATLGVATINNPDFRGLQDREYRRIPRTVDVSSVALFSIPDGKLRFLAPPSIPHAGRSSEFWKNTVWQTEQKPQLDVGTINPAKFADPVRFTETRSDPWTLLYFERQAEDIAPMPYVIKTQIGRSPFRDLSHGRLVFDAQSRLPDPKEITFALTWSHDRQKFASANAAGQITIQNSDTKEVVQRFERGTDSAVLRLTFLPDGQHLVSTGTAGDLLIWTLKSDADKLPQEISKPHDAMKISDLWNELGRSPNQAYPAWEQLQRQPPEMLKFVRVQLGGLPIGTQRTVQLDRALLLLEHFDSPESREILAAIEKKHATNWLGTEASATLKRKQHRATDSTIRPR